MTVKATQDFNINWDPKTEDDEVAQNVRFIVSTYQMQLPISKNIGLEGKGIDEPILKAKAIAIQDIVENITLQEPRAVIKTIDFEMGEEGQLIPILEVGRVNESS